MNDILAEDGTCRACGGTTCQHVVSAVDEAARSRMGLAWAFLIAADGKSLFRLLSSITAGEVKDGRVKARWI